MNVYTTRDFVGHNPIGQVAMVVARDRGHAARLLRKKLEESGLTLLEGAVFKKVHTDVAEAHVLHDGQY